MTPGSWTIYAAEIERKWTTGTLLTVSSSSSLDESAWRILGPRSCTTARRPSSYDTGRPTTDAHNT